MYLLSVCCVYSIHNVIVIIISVLLQGKNVFFSEGNYDTVIPLIVFIFVYAFVIIILQLW